MLTTPGVIRLSIGARLGTAPPPTSGISAAASAGRAKSTMPGGAMAATAPITRSADNNPFIVPRTLRMVCCAVSKRRVI